MRQLILLATISIEMLSCEKKEHISREQSVAGSWVIYKIYFKPNGMFRSGTDVSESFQGTMIQIKEDRSVSYTNPLTQFSKQGRWQIGKEPYTLTDANGITTNYEYDYLRFDWQHNPQQLWFLGQTNRDEFIATEGADNGRYTYYLKKM